MPKFIIAGESGSGKDTVAEILGYPRFAFADQIRTVAHTLRHHGAEEAYRQMFWLCNMNPPPNSLAKLEEFRRIPQENHERPLLQAIGEYFRKYDNQIWINVVREQTEGLTSCTVSDMRFFAEFEAFRDFTSIFVEASLERRLERLQKRDGMVNVKALRNQAESEVSQLKSLCDIVVKNNGDRQELMEVLKDVSSRKQDRSSESRQ